MQLVPSVLSILTYRVQYRTHASRRQHNQMGGLLTKTRARMQLGARAGEGPAIYRGDTVRTPVSALVCFLSPSLLRFFLPFFCSFCTPLRVVVPPQGQVGHQNTHPRSVLEQEVDALQGSRLSCQV